MTINKAVTFRASSIGDCLMGKYLLENIRAQYPEARCAIVVASRGTMIRDLLQAYPWIEVIEANRKSPRALLSLVKNFRGSDFVCTPYTTGAVGITTKLAARFLARRGGLIGFGDRSKQGARWYDKHIPLEGPCSPRTLELRVLKAAGVPVAVEWPTFKCLPQPGVLERFGLKQNQFIILHLFSGAEARGLSPAKRQELVNVLAGSLPPAIPLVLTGTHSERAAVLSLRLPDTAIVAAGETSVQELAALIDRSAAVVALGSGVSHIASHLGKKPIQLADCRSVPWCSPEQYGAAAGPLFTRKDLCSNGHRNKAFPDCMNEVDMPQVATECAARLQV